MIWKNSSQNGFRVMFEAPRSYAKLYLMNKRIAITYSALPETLNWFNVIVAKYVTTQPVPCTFFQCQSRYNAAMI